ncbi:iron complex transport system substrate-binding protein [Micromonospora phaseoli]|uniref:Iron complex transport system substrate-binding protein n=1 Tax=Micromonospora phaseoli TaxID=1144548 RepID=A0A1H7B0E3_9ACTN|nr:ABC transporter substrate-binding protein [Micromonospora phaseoli]PZV96236.1 iron complex transport system substrate-binding protein [Micromonospora phaseoli]GIJ75911.1 ABC transporter substrate-binding protein [Micromonospora phaseoli]SEJ67600.1 iron complex transport system substrate-binding protein [Micromonospora phaseoli]
MFRRTPRVFAATLAVAALALGACAEKTAETPAPSGSPTAAAFPVTVGDLTLEQRPERIVSLSPTGTEMLFAIGAGPQVTAVDDQSNFPADAPKTDLSGYQPNAEAIAGKEPDLVVLANDTNKIVDQLTALKIPVYLTPAAQTLDDSYRQLTELGTLTGNTDAAADVVQRMKDDIAKIVAEVPQRVQAPTYFHELGPELYTATSKTFIGSVYTLAGLENIADAADADGKSAGYPQLSQEVIVEANPDFVFLSDVTCCQQSAATVKARSGWSSINAVRNDQIVELDDDIASRWGPRVVDLLRTIVEATAKVSE